MTTENFHLFSKAIAESFEKMSSQGRELYEVALDKNELWEEYLKAFPAGTNPLFRVRTEHDCSCCRQFIRNLGGVVRLSATGRKVSTVWDVKSLPEPYATVSKVLSDYVKTKPIRSIYRCDGVRSRPVTFGAENTHELLEDGSMHTWNHFHGTVPARFVSPRAASIQAGVNSKFSVLKRGLNEITDESVETVLELIRGNNLYRGEEHKQKLLAFRDLKLDYATQNGNDNYIWACLVINGAVATIRNEVIGTLLVDLSKGVGLERAVASFETKVAPQNYKRTSALITPKMVERALSTIRELELESATERRYARLSDVSVNNVLFVDNEARQEMKDGLEGLLLEEASKSTSRRKRTGSSQEVTADYFLENVVPGAKKVNLLLENKHAPNFASLTAPVDQASGSLFQWDNNFAWSYEGEVTDSIKEKVKRAGGNINALMRVSLSWYNKDDLDIHCVTPSGQHIYYGAKAGVLDVDMNAGRIVRDPVENMAFNYLEDGEYRFSVQNYAKRESIDLGFELEYEHRGEVKNFRYSKGVVNRSKISCLSVSVKDGVVQKVKVLNKDIDSCSNPISKWGVSSQEEIPVQTIMLSPNHWDGQKRGNRHLFFMLQGCKNPGPTRGIYNEFLRSDLTKHRKVFEVLGSKTKCPPSTEQLSGVGFSSTRKDSATFTVENSSGIRKYTVKF